VNRSGFADTPLHGGYDPSWLADRMTKLGTAIVESILLHFGHAAFLSRLSDPFWFQALAASLGRASRGVLCMSEGLPLYDIPTITS